MVTSETLVYWLAAINIPVYLLIGWAIFDHPDNAADSATDMVADFFRHFLSPIGWYRLYEYNDGVFGLLKFGLFFAACAAVVYIEHLLILKYDGLVWLNEYLGN